MQLLFDVKRSLAANPPNYPENKGITHVERKRGKLSSLRTENEILFLNGIPQYK